MKISVIKFETIDGKKVGKEFSFPMDAKKMARYKTEATVMIVSAKRYHHSGVSGTTVSLEAVPSQRTKRDQRSA